MNRTICAAIAVLLATAFPAAAQFPDGPLAASAGGPGSFTDDIMTGKDQGVTGFRTRVGSSSSRLMPSDDPLAARDGCINYPGRAHNSADCSLITVWDPSWEVPNKPLSEMTGAEENMVRTYNLLHDTPFRFSYKR